MIALTFRPLRANGRVLLPVGQPVTIESDYLHTRRAIVAEAGERGWCIHKRSRDLCRCVAGEVAPAEIVYSVGGEMLLGVWKGGKS
jgi:hypothetical protein